MRIEQSFRVAADPDAVWRLLKKVEDVVPCVPGASLDGPPESGKIRGKLAVKLGPIAASFAGAGEVVYDDTARSGVLSGTGRDAKTGSSAQGNAAFSLAPVDGGTEVSVAVEYRLTGALAQFGRSGIIADIAGRLTREFAGGLEAKLAALAPSADGTIPRADVPAAQASLDLGGILWRSLWARLRALLGLKPRG